MVSILTKIWHLFDSRERVKIFLLCVLILGGTALELIGIGAILPVIALLTDPGRIHENVFLSRMYDWISPDSPNEFIMWMGAGMVGIYFLKNAYLVLLSYVQAHFLYNKNLSLSSSLFRSYLYSPYTFHLQRNTAQLLRNLQLVLPVINGVFFSLIIIFTEGMVVSALFVLLVWQNPGTSFFAVLVLIGAIVAFYLPIRKKLKHLGKVQKYHVGQLIQQVNQGIGSIKETKILEREHFFEKSYHSHLKEITHAYRYQSVISSLPRFYIETVVISLIFLLIIFFLSQGKDPHAVLYSLSLFAIVALRLMPSMTRISGAMASVRFYNANLEEVYQDLVNCEGFAPIKSKENEEKDRSKIIFESQIDLKNVTYQYENATEPALKNVFLSIPKWRTAAFVGPSGAGKTTIADVILGLLKPSEGQVMVDGQDIFKNLSSWHRQIGYIPQAIYLADDTIRANVAFGLSKEKVDEKKVWETVRLAQLEDFVYGLPNRLDTFVGEHGVRISGGQRQRIGIARALYHEPQLLIMDEATAALDNETEYAFMEAIERLSGEKTIILIAHRLSTVRNCDTIFYINNGCLLSSGSYDELLEKSLEFRQMAGVRE